MASIEKEGGGLLITFAKKNDDVRRILVEEKKKGTTLTDYVCEAIRFFVENSGKDINNNDIEEIVKKEIKRQLSTIKFGDMVVGELESFNEMGIDLEEDLDYIDIDED